MASLLFVQSLLAWSKYIVNCSVAQVLCAIEACTKVKRPSRELFPVAGQPRLSITASIPRTATF
jgi:hypothetical protein